MISVIVCTYNRSKVLANALRSLAAMTVPPELEWELLIIDNNSSDDTRAVVEQFASTSGLKVRYFFEVAQGLSHARNRGVHEARGEILAFTDDDVTVEPSWLMKLGNAFAVFNCLAVGGKIIPVWNAPKPPWFSEGGVFSMRGVIVHFDMGETARPLRKAPWGANMAFRREAFTKYGLFRTDLGRTKDSLLSGEEEEFVQRLFRGNEPVMYEPAAVVYHPVEEQRLTKRYIQSYCYAVGRSEIRADGKPWRGVCYCGFSRYHLRVLIQYVLAWLFTVNPNRRFQKKVRAYNLAGQLVEYRRLGRNTGSAVQTSKPAVMGGEVVSNAAQIELTHEPQMHTRNSV